MTISLMEKTTPHHVKATHEGGKHRLSGHGWVALAIAAVIVIAAAIWLAMYLSDRKDTSSSEPGTALERSERSFEAGNYQDARNQLEAELSETNDTEEKLLLYSNLSATAASEGNLDLALEYLAKRHQLSPDTVKQDAYIMAEYHERQGDIANALKHYKIALTFFESHSNSGEQAIVNRIEGVKARIADLEKQQ